MSDSPSILVVDDERDSLALLTSILTLEGYVVRPADSARLALASAMAKPPDLILLDLRMPGMDGFEVCRRLKACENTKNVPLIFVTAATDEAERLEGLRLGAVDFINKLYRPEEMLARIRTHMELSRLRADLAGLHDELARRRLTEQALRESEERIRNLADTAPVGIWATGLDEMASFYNKRVLTFAGRSMEQLIGNGWTDLVHPDDLTGVCSVYHAAVAARRPFRVECRMRRADGEYRWVLNAGTPRVVNGVYVGHIGTLIDTTDQKRCHEQALAAEKVESLGVLAAGIAHDFNNMLGAIFAESDVAMLETTSDSPGRQNVERIKAVAVRASEIVKLLMAYAGGSEEAMEAADISRIVAQTLDVLRDVLSDGIEVQADLAHGLPAVRANVAQIEQVVLNLIKNAVEALDSQCGLIAVLTEQTRLSQAAGLEGPGALPGGEYVRLAVSDTGRGMTPEVLAHAFDPFYTTKFLGRGLGLAVVQGILRSHGGLVHVRSRPGAGSTFEVLLPCMRETSKKPFESKVYREAKVFARIRDRFSLVEK
jgi:PAS domain S-box-containing protein